MLNIIRYSELCNSVFNATGHHCSIIGKGGIVAASSVPMRCGSLHPVAAHVMAGEIDSAIITKSQSDNNVGVLEGYVCALDINNKRIAAIGLAGKPNEVQPIVDIIVACLKATY